MIPEFNLRRVAALVRKESLQAIRDPSTILIAFALPVVMLLLFAFAVNLDIRRVPIGVVLESDGPAAQSLAAAFSGTRYFAVTPARDRREVAEAVLGGRLRGYVVIPQDFEQRLASIEGGPLVQIITDGTQPNTANFVSNYAQGVISSWRSSRFVGTTGTVTFEPRFWFNQEIESRRFLVPGAIAIIMTMIGTLLTAMVVAREWERGTMEAIMSTPASVPEILVGKLLPYFALGMAAMVLSALFGTLVLGVPLCGSWLALLLISAVFLVPALGQGLLISALTKNQFIAAQVALFSGFLPAFMLSGFLFEIDSMPTPIRMLTYVVPARYYVASLQTVFLAGDIWTVLWPNMLVMLGIGSVFSVIARLATHKRLD
ncbi:MAG: ABC transporter permease [Proteobacteria bacterium]|nr:ABC transporter permease [Pseudomonadota bacterium]